MKPCHSHHCRHRSLPTWSLLTLVVLMLLPLPEAQNVVYRSKVELKGTAHQAGQRSLEQLPAP